MDSGLRALLEELPIAAYTCDVDGRITFYNPPARELWGRAPSLGDPGDRYCGSFKLFDTAGTLVDHEVCWMALALREGRPFIGHSVVIERPDGSRRHAVASASPMRVDGELVGAVNLLTAVPDELAPSGGAVSQMFEHVFAETRDGALFVDLHGRIGRANAAALSLLGYPDEAALCAARLDVIFDTGTSELSPLPEDLRRYAGILRREVPMRRLDGSALPAELTSMLVADQRGAANSLVIFHDLRPRLQAQRQYQVSQRMEAVGHLAGGIAHNFNNVLTVIAASCALIRGRSDDPEDAEEFDRIEVAIERAAELTRRLLNFSDEGDSTPRRVGVNDAVKSSLSLLQRTMREDIRFVVELSDATGSVLFDSAEFEQLMMNYAINARDAMPDGGTIRVSTRLSKLDDDAAAALQLEPGCYAVLEVGDTGTGISSEALPKIFDPFFTTKPVGEGFGLGLSTTYGTVRRHGGTVTVQSMPGVGTTFTTYLPQVEAVQLRPQTAEPMSAVGGHESVLVVDDDALVRRTIGTVFRRAGYRVREADDGREALSLFEGGAEIDLLITDLVMPSMGGAELLRHLRPRYPELGIILLTGYGDSEAVTSSVGMGARLVRKPCRPAALLHAARELIGPPPEASEQVTGRRSYPVVG